MFSSLKLFDLIRMTACAVLGVGIFAVVRHPSFYGLSHDRMNNLLLFLTSFPQDVVSQPRGYLFVTVNAFAFYRSLGKAEKIARVEIDSNNSLTFFLLVVDFED